MKICVIGTGYVGLVTGAGFAENGSDVICADIDASKIEALNNGQIPIYEPGLEDLVARNVAARRLTFTTDVPASVKQADIIFSAVGTPPAADGSADLSAVWAVARTVAEHATGFTILANKSTVPVGTADRVKEILNETAPDKDFAVVSNPEFLKEGDAVNDFLRPQRVIIGCNDNRAHEAMRYIYEPFVRKQDRILVMDPRSAEVTKYACNAMLATRISFMNEIARLCDQVGANVEYVRQGMTWDDRIGSRFLFPGVGYGGSCFPKDVKAIISTAKDNGTRLEVLEAVESVNEAQKRLLANRVLKHFEGRSEPLRVAIWGLAFKPKTDDVREAPAFTVCKMLLDAGGELRLHDPIAIENYSQLLPASDRVQYFDYAYDAVEGADALLLMTEWPAFRRPDFERIKTLMRNAAIFDGRNIWDAAVLRGHGFHYESIGRP